MWDQAAVTGVEGGGLSGEETAKDQKTSTEEAGGRQKRVGDCQGIKGRYIARLQRTVIEDPRSHLRQVRERV